MSQPSDGPPRQWLPPSGREAQQRFDVPGLTQEIHLGRVGEAERYRALQPTTGRAVEVLVLDGEPSTERVEGFVRDGAIGARLSGQSGVVPVFDAGVTPSGRHYLVRPYYSRGSLGRLIRDHGPIGWREAVHLVEQLAVTTAEIHGWGIVHQGLEPGNIMLTEFLGLRVGAFGASMPIGGDLIIGANATPLGPYAAPELGRTREAQPTSDVYSLGAILWALLAGRDPVSTMDPATELPLPAPAAGTPEHIQALLQRSMSRQVHERPATAAAFVTELRQAIAASDANEPGAHRARPARVPAPQAGAAQPAEIGSGAGGSTAPTAGPAASGAADLAGAGTSTAVSGEAQAQPGAGELPTRSGPAPEARYILILVAMIAMAILFMVVAAFVAV